MRQPLFLFFTLLTGLVLRAQSSFESKDIEGIWTREDGMRIEIKGRQARIITVGKSQWPPKAIGGKRFTSIKYIGDGKWEAVNHSWRYPDKNREGGRWYNYGITTLVLSADKTKLSGGNTAFIRDLELSDNTSVSKPPGVVQTR